MLYREIIAVFSDIGREHMNALWVKHRFVTVKPGGTYSNHWTLIRLTDRNRDLSYTSIETDFVKASTEVGCFRSALNTFLWKRDGGIEE
jgi:hypothetical protein